MKYKQCNLKGYEKLYYIYENGDIYSVRKRRFIKPIVNNSGYLLACLTGHNKQRTRIGIHRLVAAHFIGPVPDPHPLFGRYEVNHVDMNKTNNHFTNLEYVTHFDNIMKARKNKQWNSGRKPGYKHNTGTKQLMSEKKKKSTILEKDGVSINCESIQAAANYLNVSRRTIERRQNSYATVKGFKVRTL